MLRIRATRTWLSGSHSRPSPDCADVSFKTGFLVFLALLAVAGASIVYCYRAHTIMAYNDGFGHLKIARFVVLGFQPGAAQLGGVWPPVPHLLMLPLVWNDWAFRSGIAGAVPSAVCFAATGLFIFLITYRITRQITAGFIGLIVFATNPNALYMASVPMTDMILPAFMAGATYFLLKWAVEPGRLGSLTFAGLMALLASLTRYEGWGFSLAAVAFVGIVAFSRRDGWRASRAYAVTFAATALYGVCLWLLWNAVILGDPLYFRSGMYSAAAVNQSLHAYLGNGHGPAYHDLRNAFGDVARAANWNAGPIVSALAVVGFVLWLVRERLNVCQLAALLLVAPGLVLAAAFFTGDTFVLLPWRDDRLHNIRYGLIVLPALAIFAGYLARGHRLLGLSVVLLALTQSALLLSQNDVVTYLDATRGLGGGAVLPLSVGGDQTSFEATRPTIDWLNQNFDSGSVLLDSSYNNQVLFTEIPTGDFLQEGVFKTWDAALANPAAYVDWIYMRKSDSFPDRVYNALRNSPQLARFVRVYELHGTSIYVSRSHYTTWLRSRQVPGATARALPTELGGGLRTAQTP